MKDKDTTQEEPEGDLKFYLKLCVSFLFMFLLTSTEVHDFVALNFYRHTKARVSMISYVYDDTTWTCLNFYLTVNGKEYTNKERYTMGRNKSILVNDTVEVLYNPLFPKFSTVKLAVIKEYLSNEKK